MNEIHNRCIAIGNPRRTPAGEDDTFELYQDKSGEWRWRRKAVNGEIVEAASEGYVNRADCEANAQRDVRSTAGWNSNAPTDKGYKEEFYVS